MRAEITKLDIFVMDFKIKSEIYLYNLFINENTKLTSQQSGILIQLIPDFERYFSDIKFPSYNTCLSNNVFRLINRNMQNQLVN
ncbi:hypothetical protein RhiirA4_469907 [Rhizophagus irregularis]|uniref:Uncharacterized protein n=1 Tax=Rhizophagus irregularis TaxID=588596 RepID=A0A2I1H0C8_9GLOM|nr:hypothetical protein RhiirA4_469907 [Rhizophagus irregularis]